MTAYWIKLYEEILDDPKMAMLPDRLWRRTIETFLIAGREGKDGMLPPTEQLAWILRVDASELEKDLQAIAAQTGIICKTPAGWMVVKFADRQRAMTPAEKQRAYRERRHHDEYESNEQYNPGHNQPVTNSVTKSNVDQITDNRLQITDNRSEEEGRNAPPASSFRMNFQPDYVRIWSAVTGMVAIPNDEMERVMDAINGLTLRYMCEADLVAFLRPFYDAWKIRKAKNGRTYSKLNAGWIDWAIAGEIPDANKPPGSGEKQYAEVYE